MLLGCGHSSLILSVSQTSEWHWPLLWKLYSKVILRNSVLVLVSTALVFVSEISVLRLSKVRVWRYFLELVSTKVVSWEYAQNSTVVYNFIISLQSFFLNLFVNIIQNNCYSHTRLWFSQFIWSWFVWKRWDHSSICKKWYIISLLMHGVKIADSPQTDWRNSPFT